MAKKYHPDMNPGDTEAEKKFKEASEAYAVSVMRTNGVSMTSLVTRHLKAERAEPVASVALVF